MYAIPFTTKVLGKDAAMRLLLHRVTRTVRFPGAIEAYRQAMRNKEKVGITLDTKFIGSAAIESVEPVSWANLKFMNLGVHGFSDVADLRGALRRAGFRFKDLAEYDMYLVVFYWTD